MIIGYLVGWYQPASNQTADVIASIMAALNALLADQRRSDKPHWGCVACGRMLSFLGPQASIQLISHSFLRSSVPLLTEAPHLLRGFPTGS
jgi:hypothetical protein